MGMQVENNRAVGDEMMKIIREDCIFLRKKLFAENLTLITYWGRGD